MGFSPRLLAHHYPGRIGSIRTAALATTGSCPRQQALLSPAAALCAAAAPGWARSRCYLSLLIRSTETWHSSDKAGCHHGSSRRAGRKRRCAVTPPRNLKNAFSREMQTQAQSHSKIFRTRLITPRNGAGITRGIHFLLAQMHWQKRDKQKPSCH